MSDRPTTGSNLPPKVANWLLILIFIAFLVSGTSLLLTKVVPWMVIVLVIALLGMLWVGLDIEDRHKKLSTSE